jgi:hypothetical protein
MRRNESLVGRSLVSGTAAGITTTLTAALAGQRETGHYAAPLNATSHALWGEAAARQDRLSLKYTAVGFAFNYLASIMWAAVYEKWFAPARRRPASSLQPLLGAAAVTAGAYITDYYLVPKRFTPGFEKRLSGKGLVAIYGALALGLVAGTLLSERN